MLTAVRAAVTSGEDADDVLRHTVRALADEDGVSWAAIAFVEGDGLVVGPESGHPDEPRRRRAAVRHRGEVVAEVWVDGDVDPDALEEVADLVADHCLVGWDTGGAPWGE